MRSAARHLTNTAVNKGAEGYDPRVSKKRFTTILQVARTRNISAECSKHNQGPLSSFCSGPTSNRLLWGAGPMDGAHVPLHVISREQRVELRFLHCRGYLQELREAKKRGELGFDFQEDLFWSQLETIIASWFVCVRPVQLPRAPSWCSWCCGGAAADVVSPIGR